MLDANGAKHEAYVHSGKKSVLTLQACFSAHLHAILIGHRASKRNATKDNSKHYALPQRIVGVQEPQDLDEHQGGGQADDVLQTCDCCMEQ